MRKEEFQEVKESERRNTDPAFYLLHLPSTQHILLARRCAALTTFRNSSHLYTRSSRYSFASVLLYFCAFCIRIPLPEPGVLTPAIQNPIPFRQKPYTLSVETLYPFSRNPIPFQWKPYTLSVETLYPFDRNSIPFQRKPYTLSTGNSLSDGSQQDICRQSVRCYSGRACPFLIVSSAISVSDSMRKKYRRMVCVKMKMSIDVLGSGSLKEQ